MGRIAFTNEHGRRESIFTQNARVSGVVRLQDYSGHLDCDIAFEGFGNMSSTERPSEIGCSSLNSALHMEVKPWGVIVGLATSFAYFLMM